MFNAGKNLDKIKGGAITAYGHELYIKEIKNWLENVWGADARDTDSFDNVLCEFIKSLNIKYYEKI